MNAREAYLKRIPGAEDALKAVREQAKGSQRALSAAGVVHKQARKPQALNVAQKAMLEELRAKLATVLSEVSDSVDEALVDEITMVVLSSLAHPVEAEAPVEEIAIEEDYSEMAEDDEEEIFIEEEEDKRRMGKAVARKQTRLLDTLTQSQADIVKALMDIQHTQASLTPLAVEVKALKTEVAALKQQLTLRPRAASKAAATLVTDEEIKQMDAMIDAEEWSDDPVLGKRRKLYRNGGA